MSARVPFPIGCAAKGTAGCLLALLVVQSGCTLLGRTKKADFFPLNPSDTWVYQLVRLGGSSRAQFTVRARGDRFIEPLRKRCLLVEEAYSSSNGSPAQVQPIAYCYEGGFLHRALSLEYHDDAIVEVGTHSAEERFLPERLTSGAEWDGVTTAYDLGDGNGYVVHHTHHARRDLESVDVPAGRFDGCIRVDTVAVQETRQAGRRAGEPVILYYTDWYAPDIGWVRSVVSTRPDQSTRLAETLLVDFEVGGRRSPPRSQ